MYVVSFSETPVTVTPLDFCAVKIMTSLSDSNKLKFSVESILGTNNESSSKNEAISHVRPQDPPCAGCVAALYRCCRDEPSPLLQMPLALPYAHLHPALRPTTGKRRYTIFNFV